ncbi:DUF5798 family protein [Halovivax cerinus]|uniref:DUF5798 family protein n=1 Tax=Halovivax cerinus TaxID=1487865 RepID=A0ABD5NK83_9EURY|nr:DUF5798 family protein [Halovivax cerinus]
MGLGSTAKKIQLVSEKAEQMYKQVQELQGRIVTLEGAVDETHDTVTDLEGDVAEQRALLEAIAADRGLDVDAILTEAAIEDADEETGSTASESGDDAGESGDDADESGDGAGETGDAHATSESNA